MTELSYPWDSGEGANITEDQWRVLARGVGGYKPGVLPDELNRLAVFADSTGLLVKVPSGIATAYGHVYVNDNEFSLPLSSNSSGAVRWDRIVVQFDMSTNLARVIVKQGTNDPVGPALTQNRTALYELGLAFVQVDNLAANIASNRVFLERDRWAAPLGSHITTVEDFFADVAFVPVDAVLCFGQALDWHFYPKIRAVCPTYNGNDWGFNVADNLIYFPDLRGNVVAGLDGMGGVRANRMTNVTLTSPSVGKMTGADRVDIAEEQMPQHHHSMNHDHPDASSAVGHIHDWTRGGTAPPSGNGVNGSSEAVFVADDDPGGAAHFIPTQNWVTEVRDILRILTSNGSAVPLEGRFGRWRRMVGTNVTVAVPTRTQNTGNDGAGDTHNNTQPTAVANKIMRVC